MLTHLTTNPHQSVLRERDKWKGLHGGAKVLTLSIAQSDSLSGYPEAKRRSRYALADSAAHAQGQTALIAGRKINIKRTISGMGLGKRGIRVVGRLRESAA